MSGADTNLLPNIFLYFLPFVPNQAVGVFRVTDRERNEGDKAEMESQ